MARRIASSTGTPSLVRYPNVSPDAVTNVAWARLIIPPSPVTITNESITSDKARPRVTRPTQKSSATKST